jgi:hypothetical protein
MNFKKFLLSILLITFALLLISNVCAADNESVLENNILQGDSAYPDLEFEQKYGPSTTIHEDDVFNAYLNVKNTGNKLYKNLTIYYPLPKDLELIIYPIEYDGSYWTIDTLNPGESNTLVLVCSPLVPNTTYEFIAAFNGQEVTKMDVYCEPAANPDNNTDHHEVMGIIPDETSVLKNTANPIFLLLFALIFIPYIRLKD